MKALIIGSGGREHAMAWKLSQSDKLTKIYVAPGNAGTALENPEGTTIENLSINPTDITQLLTFAQQEQIDLTIVGPEVPLVAGLVDQFEQAGLKCLGPNKMAAQLEGSKAFCKTFLKKYHIPTAHYASFTELDAALNYIEQQTFPLVIKADGLAAGKGVVIAQTRQEASNAIQAMLINNKFGAASHKIIIEDFLVGQEASFIILTDGKTIVPLATSQDHKARDDGDKGPNTGGMGAYSPAPLITPKIHQHIMHDIIEPTIKGLATEGINYKGFLYAGLMIDAQGKVKVLEFNCRLGDPETQPILMRLNSDLYDLAMDCVNHRLEQTKLQWSPNIALGVVMASGGYPDSYDKGHQITGLNQITLQDTKVFHAGTKLDTNHQPVTDGGRVLCVTSLGKSVQDAQKKAYASVNQIHWKDSFYRKDIGDKAL